MKDHPDTYIVHHITPLGITTEYHRKDWNRYPYGYGGRPTVLVRPKLTALEVAERYAEMARIQERINANNVPTTD